MTRHYRTRPRNWMPSVLAGILVAGHGMVLYYASSHLALSAGLLSGAIVLIVIKHLELLGPALALFRRRLRKECSGPDGKKGRE